MVPRRAALALLSGLVAAIAACASAATAEAAPQPRVILAFLPAAAEPDDIARHPQLAPGLLSAGLGDVPPSQTYLDVGQGSRIFSSLYEGRLPPLFVRDGRVPPDRWRRTVDRAAEVPAEIIPGLLGSTLENAGVPVRVERGGARPGVAGVDGEGRIAESRGCLLRDCRGLTVASVTPARLLPLIAGLRGRDLLIALERPPPKERKQLAIGIAGHGYEGDLTSDSTRRDGLVVSTDLAPTILERFGLDPPDEMDGQPIRAEGSPDPAAVSELGDRLAEVAPRRDSVIRDVVIGWVVIALLAAVALGLARGSAGEGARLPLRLLALSAIYLPGLLLVAAALDPSLSVERLVVGVGAPALAGLTVALLPGFRALAMASGLTVLAFGADVVAGSPYTPLSLIGPNPALGVRFYGIGNELEAALSVLLLAGTGAALAAWRPNASGRRLAIAFALAGLLGVVAFAPGRFGADVGAAIVIPIGAAVAAAVVLGSGRRTILAVVAAPLIVLAALAAADLLLGGDAHLTRAVFDAGGFDEVADVAERRLRLSARSFAASTDRPLFWIALVLVLAGVLSWRSVLTWYVGKRAALAGVVGAAAATLVGTLANDSGALLLMIGATYVALATAYAWAEQLPVSRKRSASFEADRTSGDAPR